EAVQGRRGRAVPTEDGVQARLAGVDVPAAERVGESRWQVRRTRDRARTLGDGSWTHGDLLSEGQAAFVVSDDQVRVALQLPHRLRVLPWSLPSPPRRTQSRPAAVNRGLSV